MFTAASVRKSLVRQSNSHHGRPESRGKKGQLTSSFLYSSELQPMGGGGLTVRVDPPLTPGETQVNLLSHLSCGSKPESACTVKITMSALPNVLFGGY